MYDLYERNNYYVKVVTNKNQNIKTRFENANNVCVLLLRAVNITRALGERWTMLITNDLYTAYTPPSCALVLVNQSVLTCLSEPSDDLLFCYFSNTENSMGLLWNDSVERQTRLKNRWRTQSSGRVQWTFFIGVTLNLYTRILRYTHNIHL